MSLNVTGKLAKKYENGRKESESIVLLMWQRVKEGRAVAGEVVWHTAVARHKSSRSVGVALREVWCPTVPVGVTHDGV